MDDAERLALSWLFPYERFRISHLLTEPLECESKVHTLNLCVAFIFFPPLFAVHHVLNFSLHFPFEFCMCVTRGPFHVFLRFDNEQRQAER